MAKTVKVSVQTTFDTLHADAKIKDYVTVTRAMQIYSYFEEHFSIDSFRLDVSGNAVVEMDAGYDCQLPVDDAFVETLLRWATDLPELQILVKSPLPDDEDIEVIPVYRKTLVESLPLMRQLLDVQTGWGFYIWSDLKPLKPEKGGAASEDDAARTNVMLNGKVVTPLQLQGVNTPVNELDIPRWIMDYFGSKGWVYIGDVLSREGMEPILLEPSDPRDGMDPAPWKDALRGFELSDEDNLSGWKRPE